ncbi:hypothetical protein [Noviherbaspirillum aridicola]|uniref:Uncharacterized protein n=1 Tax=Noviherbaspirillum aridicola TaxID=2849687 RepID=A0ABQ4Q8F3_9BURK|nr:hypothetical protein [Noviherbaspirillum aridicola]GIZ53357.1 hypothetical protein NCCP691_33710 [Noviherbaspirillum aridicola]
MRILPAVLLTLASTSLAHAATQQQCEALMKPVEAKMEGMQKLKDGDKPSPATCARGKEVIRLYADYAAQADKLNCPFAYVSGQKFGGKAERAELIADLQEAYKEKCR